MKNSEDDAGGAAEEAGKKAEDAGHRWQGWGTIMNGVKGTLQGTLTLVLSVAAGVAAISAAMGGLMITSATTADNLVTLSLQTGITTTRLQELAYAGDQLGFSLDTVTGANARLIRSMGSASQQTADYEKKVKDAAAAGKSIEDIQLGDAAQAFKDLGVSVTDASGNLRDNQAVFNDVIDALGRVENPAQRDALAMTLLGKNAQELNPLIKAGSDELARLKDEAHRTGAVVGTDTVSALEGLSDQLDGLKDGLKGVGMNFAGAFAPFVSGVLDQAQGYLGRLVAIVDTFANRGGGMQNFTNGLVGLFRDIVKDAAAQAPQMLQAGLSILQALIGAIVSALPQMLDAGLQIIEALVGFIVQNLPMIIGAGLQILEMLVGAIAQSLPLLVDAGVKILLMLVNAIIKNLPMLVNAALQAIITLANGLAGALPTLIPAVIQAILLIVQILLDNMPMLIDAALKLIMGLANGLVQALPVLIPMIPQIVQSISELLLQSLPLIANVAGQLIITLGAGIIASLPGLIGAALQIVQTLYNTIGPTAQLKLLKEIGKGFVEGVWKGIQDARDWFYGMISDFFSGMVESVLDTLGIHSPSTVGIGIGNNFIGSIGMGGMQSLRKVEAQFRAGFANMAQAIAPSAASPVSAATAGGQIINLNFYGVSFGSVTRETTVGALYDRLKLPR
jgi:hypothetical protein